MTPRFVIKINKLGIYYYYLSNLALEGKKFWVRKKYNEKFISVVGPLNQQEKKSINLLGRLIVSSERKKPSFNLLEVFFDKNPWGKLASSIERTEYKNITKAFDILNKKWRIFWQRELASETAPAKKYLETNIQKEKLFINRILKNLSVLYGQVRLPPTIKIFLIPLPADIQERGGKYLPPLNSVILESSSKKVREKRTIEILLHETTHLCFENQRFFENIHKVENRIPNHEKRKLIMPFRIPSVEFGTKEIIATSLTIKPNLKKRGVSPYLNLLFYASKKLQPSINHYLKNKKPLDENFIEEVLKLWKLYLKNNGHPRT